MAGLTYSCAELASSGGADSAIGQGVLQCIVKCLFFGHCYRPLEHPEN